MDVRDAAAVERAASSLSERTGPPDILVNSAGISSSTPPGYPHRRRSGHMISHCGMTSWRQI